MEKERKLIKAWLDWEIEDRELAIPLEKCKEWDSFNIMQFMTEAEARYGIAITLDDLDSINTVMDLLEYMAKCENKRG